MSKHCILVRPGESAEGRAGVTYAAGEQEDVTDLPQLANLLHDLGR